uniref:Uncharacterized protein n=1 Tax=Glossina palpalis gambiensis TaxID=67801 RepID=A0A1B0AQ40_9MUSC
FPSACQTEQKRHLDRGPRNKLVNPYHYQNHISRRSILSLLSCIYMPQIIVSQTIVSSSVPVIPGDRTKYLYLNKTYKYCCTHVMCCFRGEGGLKCLTVGFITSNVSNTTITFYKFHSNLANAEKELEVYIHFASDGESKSSPVPCSINPSVPPNGRRVIGIFKHIKIGNYNCAANNAFITEQELTSSGRGKHGCKI